MRIVPINCESLRKRRKQLELGDVLSALKIGLCVATENHLRLEARARIDITGYEVLGHSCSEAWDFQE